MIENMINIIKTNDLCVLATVSARQPHCSLMAYVTDDECREIYLISYKHTKKYANLMENPKVSLLIDTRHKDKQRRREDIKALTVYGNFQTIEDSNKRDTIKEKFLQKHPHLTNFLYEPDVDIFLIKIKSLQLLAGVKDSFFETLD